MSTSQGPRIPPLPASERDEQAQELLGGVGGLTGPASNIFDTLVRHPGLFRKWMPFGGKLLTGKLPPRDRELLILRTGWNCRSDYEWGQHVLIGRSVGLNDDEIARIVQGPGAGWEEFERVLLTAADELHERSRISDGTWAALADRYDEKQLIELVMLVGHYHMVAFTLNTLGVEREEGVPALPEGK